MRPWKQRRVGIKNAFFNDMDTGSVYMFSEIQCVASDNEFLLRFKLRACCTSCRSYPFLFLLTAPPDCSFSINCVKILLQMYLSHSTFLGLKGLYMLLPQPLTPLFLPSVSLATEESNLCGCWGCRTWQQCECIVENNNMPIHCP